MLIGHSWVKSLLTVVLVTGLASAPAASAADKDAAKKVGKVAGIMFGFDLKANWITVKADGEDEPVKYLVPPDKKLSDVLGKTVFPVSRVQLTYKKDGDTRQLVSINRQVLQPPGTVTGTVIGNYGWWIEVKPNKGVSDGYAVHFPFDKNQEMMDKVKDLQPGDSVTIMFSTDSERNRIEALQKNPSRPPKRPNTGKKGKPAK